MNVILLENGSKEGRLLKLLVKVELHKPIMRGTTIKLDDEQVWVDFRYEQLPKFCFYCGGIRHRERGCELKMEDFMEGTVCEGQYGAWLGVNSPRGDKIGGTTESSTRRRKEQRNESKRDESSKEREKMEGEGTKQSFR